jgi:large subunit ribosomal protein L20
MARVKRGVTSHAKHKKVYKATKGHYGRRRNTIRIAKQSMEKAMQYAYRDRKNKKRTFRALWIQRINAAVRPFGLNYSKFIDGLAKAGIMVDRKVMSELAIMEPAAFQVIVEKAKAALPVAKAACREPLLAWRHLGGSRAGTLRSVAGLHRGRMAVVFRGDLRRRLDLAVRKL